MLEEDGIGTRVVSMPCMELFAEQDEAIASGSCPPARCGSPSRPGVRLGWDRWLYGERGARGKAGFIGMDGFGASAPAEVLYEEFGITAKAVATKARDLVAGKWAPDTTL